VELLRRLHDVTRRLAERWPVSDEKGPASFLPLPDKQYPGGQHSMAEMDSAFGRTHRQRRRLPGLLERWLLARREDAGFRPVAEMELR